MKDEKLIHIKLEYSEALKSKKDILSSEINLLRTKKFIKNYNSIRMNELRKKMAILTRIRKLKTYMTKLQQTLPKIKIPKILEKYDKPEEELMAEIDELEEEPEEELREMPHDDGLEDQLREIQERLRNL